MKTILIKNKEYVTVAERLRWLREENTLPYNIVTEVTFNELMKMFIVKATLEIGENTYVGHSQAVIGDGMVNKTAALENAETSAVGRACAMAGIGIIEQVASADEMKKAGVKPDLTGIGQVTINDEPF